jgi:hypothetical protein
MREVGVNLVKSSAVGAVTVVLLACTSVAVAGQSASEAPFLPALVTESVEPGVERILRDEVGHDLTQRHPSFARDMDHIAIAPDGTVWIASTAHGPDNGLLDGFQVWALGRPGIYGSEDGIPRHIDSLAFDSDGTLHAVGSSSASFDGEGWSGRPSPRQTMRDSSSSRVVTPDGTLWIIDPRGGVEAWDGTRFTYHLGGLPIHELGVAADGTVWAVGEHGSLRFDGQGWAPRESSSRRAVATDGRLWLVRPEGGIESWDGAEFTTYLAGSSIPEIAVAPDGAVWAVGTIGDNPGGVYVIRPTSGRTE